MRARHLTHAQLGSHGRPRDVKRRAVRDVGAILEDRAFHAERLEYLANLNTTEDYRINFEGNLVAPISKHIGLKVGYVVKFDNLPEPGVKSTDRFATAGLQVTY